MRLLITGNSNWKDEDLIKKKFAEFRKLYSKSEHFELIQFGTTWGVDADVRKIGRKYGIYTYTYRANGKMEKCIRNSKVLKNSKPNLIWLFCRDPSLWMKDLIKKAKRRNIPVTIFHSEESEDLQLDLFDFNV